MTVTIARLRETIEGLPDHGAVAIRLGKKQPDRSAERMRAHIDSGAWPSWPLDFRPGKQDCLGLRVVPGKAVREWPLVILQRCSAGTYTTDGRSIAPAILYVGLLENGSRKWERLEGKWPSYVDGLRPLHELLGSHPDSLDALTRLMLDPSFRERRSLRQHTSPEALDADHLDLLQLDPSPEHRVARDFVHQCMRHGVVGSVPSGVGRWQNLCAAIAFSTLGRLTRTAQPPEIVPHAWTLLQGAVGFDSNVDKDTGGHRAGYTGILADRTVAGAMATIGVCVSEAQLDAFAATPLWHVLQARAERKEDWDLEYMKAAAEYDTLGDGEMSWNMLCSGAFWSVYRRGVAIRPYFDAARDLARKYDWTDVSDALGDMATRAQL